MAVGDSQMQGRKNLIRPHEVRCTQKKGKSNSQFELLID